VYTLVRNAINRRVPCWPPGGRQPLRVRKSSAAVAVRDAKRYSTCAYSVTVQSLSTLKYEPNPEIPDVSCFAGLELRRLSVDERIRRPVFRRTVIVLVLGNFTNIKRVNENVYACRNCAVQIYKHNLIFNNINLHKLSAIESLTILYAYARVDTI